MWDIFHLPLLNDSEGILRIPLNYFILPFLVLVLSSLLFFGNSNPTLYAHHPSEFLGYTVDRNFGDAFGHVSDITISMNCRDCFISSYSMMLPSFSPDSSGLIISLSESTSSSLSPHNAHQSLCSSSCRLCSACSSAFAPGYVMAGHPNRYNLAREIANDLTHSIDILSCPTMPLSEDHSFLHPHPLGLLLIAALSITLLVVSIISTMLTTGSRMSSIPSMLIFLAVLCVSFQSVLGYGFSEECSMYLSEDDHLVCNEVYPGRYAAECEEGYYYDQGDYSCVYDSNSECPSDMNDHQMCVKTADGDLITSDCRSAWYGDDCDQLYSVHIPDKLFRGKVCDAISNNDPDITVDPLCDVSEFEMAGINWSFYSNSSHITSEDDADYWTFITSVFPIHDESSSYTSKYFIPNSCPLNITEYSCASTSSLCPSIVLNEVYNSIDGVNEKQCAFIAKEGSAGECYTVHDDDIRQYLKDYCLSGNDPETNGIISAATMRSKLTCSSLSLFEVVSSSSSSVSTVDEITTLQGLEYATSLTSLNIDGYDLSGDINENAEYDKLVVQILAKAVLASSSYGSINSGLTSLSASGCGLSAVSDVLDLTPIVNEDSATQPFKLTSLDLSNNNISDVSVLITSSMFSDGVLTTLDISGNNICDIEEGMVSALESNFTTLSSITYSDQTCNCSASVSSSSYQVCREVYPNQWAVECWNGYYLDKASGDCVAACDSGYELDTSTTPYSCVSVSTSVDDAIRVQVCEGHSNMMPVLEEGASSITCGCRSGLHGDSCEYVDIPDSNLRSAVCLAVVNPSAHDSSCDDLTISDMATVTSVSASIVDSFEGLQSAVNLTSLSISGTSSSSVSIGNTDLGYLPLSLVELSLEAVYLDADSDFSFFTDLTTLSLKNNSSYDLTNSAIFPSSSSSSSSFTSLDVSYTALSSFSSIPTSITTLTANNCSSLTSFSTISNLTNLVYLDADSDFSFFTDLTTLSLKNNSSYDLTNSAIFPSSSSSSSSFTSLDVSYTALSSFSSIPTSITTLTANNCSSLTSFSTISNLTNLVSLDVSYASSIPTSSSLSAFASLSLLTSLNLSSTGISDPSPLYALSSNSSWISLDLSNNYICGGDDGDSAIETFLASKFSPATVSASGQDCICSSDDLGTTPLDANKVCSETKPGSGAWYVVCASDSYTSYTSAEDFSCTQPDSSTTNCSGGCEYGYECRYLGDEEIDDVSYSTGECQQVIVDENLHYAVYDLFGGVDTHCNLSDQTFSVASLKTLVSEETDTEYVYTIDLYYADTANPISDLAGVEHLVSIKYISFIGSVFSSDIAHLELLSNLTNLVILSFFNNLSLTSLPDLSGLDSLEILVLTSTSISLPSSEYVLPTAIKMLFLQTTNTDTDGFAKNVGNDHLPHLERLSLGGNDYITSIDSLSQDQRENISSFIVVNTTLGDEYNDVIVDMINLELLKLVNCSLTTIPDLTNSASSLVKLSLKTNPLIASFSPLASSGLVSLTTLNVSGCNICDPSPLYALSSNTSWSSIDLSYNNICGDQTTNESFLESKFSPADVDVSNQSCVCSSDDLGTTPLASNKVCSETKPGSNTWYVVCASDSYTTYTSAEDFTCTQPTSSSTNCSGGCEYGYECRYLGIVRDVSISYSTGECQQVIVDENLHDYVADLFNDYDGTANYIHRTADTPSLFSVASLKTLVSVSMDSQYYPQIQYNDPSLPIDDLSGIEHLGGIKWITFFGVFSADSDDIHLDLLSTLTNLVLLNLSKNSSLSYLPTLTSLTSLEVLAIQKTSIILPSEEYILPTSLKSFYCALSNVNNEGFAKNVGNGYLTDIEQLAIGGDNNLLTSIDSLTTSQKENMKYFMWRISPIDTFENYPDILAEMPNLETLSLVDCNLQTIPDLSIQAETLTILNINLNPLLASLTPIVSSGLTNLTYLYARGCAISDPSPLFALSSNTWSYFFLSNNYICGDDVQTILEDIFSSSPDLFIDVSNQTCGCSDSDPIPSLSDNKVCGETKPGSNTWYVVCASDSYTSYTSAEDFTCIQPDSSTTNCSGGCEYGQECRYLGDEEISGVSYSNGECQQVIVDENLHACVADMFVDSDGDPDYSHRTATSPSLFSVASLKTLVSVDDGYGVYSPVLSCPSMCITDLTGIEHITEIASFDLSLNNLNTDVSPACLDSLMHLSHLLSLNLGSNSNITILPDLTGMSSLTVLRLKSSNAVNLPSETSQDPYLPSSLEGLVLYNCSNFDQGAFDAHIGSDHLPNLKYLNLYLTAVSSLSTLTQTQRDSITTLVISIPDSQNVVPTMHNLETLTITNTTITSIPDLSNSADKLTFLNISKTSVSSLVEAGTLSNLETIKFLDCHVSDLSPLYHLSSLTSVHGTGNNICVGSAETIETIKLKFVSHASLTLDLWTTLSTDQTCECSSTDLGTTPIADSLICSETKPWSNTWYVVCASDSYTSYTSAEDFSCISPANADGTFGCSGGCEYGQECRYDSDSTSTSCQQVIVDENLHAYVADMFVDSDGDPDYTHRTATSPSLFSVASLRILSASTLSNNGFALSNSDRFSLLDGIEYIRSLTSISLPYHNFVSADPLGSLHGLESLSLAHNMYGAPEDAGGNAIEGFSDLSFICSLHSLSTLALSSVTSVSALPDTSECADTYTSLSSLNLAETSIIDVSVLLVAADSTNVSLTELIMNGVSLYDDVAETTSLFDPSILE
ncbi:hypothetical protein ADUPG1_008365, partial [Aduncisulcus paluster]